MNKITRIRSIDLLRGTVMLLMMLDHVRDYFHADAFFFSPTDLNKTSVSLFFTRWITHFCAPIFIFLAGTSAYLAGQRKTKRQMSSFLIKRGLWLILLELTLVNFGFSFDPAFRFQMLTVIWVLGVGMICLAVALFLPAKLILIIGLVLVAGHNLLDAIHVSGQSVLALCWAMLNETKPFSYPSLFLFKERIDVIYPILPWIGPMLLGYCLGPIFGTAYSPEQRKTRLFALGFSCLLAFLILRLINLYGDPNPWQIQSSTLYTLLSFINILKYPPSLDYALVTLSGALFFLAVTEHATGRIVNFVSVYGRVPLFFYLLHLYVIHLLALLAVTLCGRPWTDMVFFKAYVNEITTLQGYGFSLRTVYFIWIALILLLYPPCKRYDNYKRHHKEKWWLSYL